MPKVKTLQNLFNFVIKNAKDPQLQKLAKSKLNNKPKTRKTKNKTKQMPPKFIKVAEQKLAQLAVKEGKKLVKKNATKIGALAGSAVGGITGNPALAIAAGEGVSHIIGHGDYTVISNSLTTKSGTASVIPKFTRSGRGTRIVHSEYLGDVVSGTANTFTNQSYWLNPGNTDLFPWLAAFAQQFDQWKPNGIVFSFKSTSSSYAGASTQALGGIVLASDYDVIDAPFSSKVEMENSQFAVSTKSDCNSIHAIECAAAERPIELLKVRSSVTPSDNLQWYDLCNFQVATFGVPASNTNLGELWVSYDITFFKEQVYGGIRGYSILQTSFRGITGISTSAYTGTDGLVAETTGNLACTFNGTVLTFPSNVPVGTYQVSYMVEGASTAIVPPTFTASSGLTIDFEPTSFNLSYTGNKLFVTRNYNVTAGGATITLSGGTLNTSPTNAVLAICQLNPSFCSTAN